jgi:glycosyltransferase involved in cell wall biosynthesis
MTMESLKKQTFQDFEVLIVDNNSEDDSIAIAQSYEEYFPSFQILKETVQGLPSARNKGIDHAKGKYLCFVDPDDELTSDYLQDFYQAMKTGVDVAICNYQCIDFRTKKLLSQSDISSYQTTNPALTRQAMFDDGYMWNMWNKCFKRELVETLKLRCNPRLLIAEDLLFSITYLKHCQSAQLVEKANYLYYRHEQSLTNEVGFNEEKHFCIIYAWDLVFAELKEFDPSTYQLAFVWSVRFKITELKKMKMRKYPKFKAYRKQYRPELFGSFFKVMTQKDLSYRIKLRRYLANLIYVNI